MVVSVCAILVPELLLAPLTPLCEVVHENVAPATLLVNAMDVAPPEQKLCEDGVAVVVGIGLTVTVATMAVPLHPPADGTMV